MTPKGRPRGICNQTMASILLRLLAGVLLLPPFTPFGIALWWYAHRRDAATKRQQAQLEQLKQINNQ